MPCLATQEALSAEALPSVLHLFIAQKKKEQQAGDLISWNGCGILSLKSVLETRVDWVLIT